jgi:8-oxo-dGTP pyrophosphatase MutT (NUDIX family)
MLRHVMDEKGAVSAIVGIVDTLARSTLVLRRFDADPDFPGNWCFPGGQAHPGEATDKTVVREAREETGLTVQQLEYLGRRKSVGATGRIYLIDCFLTESWTGSLLTFPSAEHAGAAWVSLETLSELAPIGATTRWLSLTLWSRFRSSG